MKRSFQLIFRGIILMTLVLITGNSIKAQSTVYFFMRDNDGIPEGKLQIRQDDDKLFSLRGGIKKEYKHYDWYPEGVNLIKYKPTVRKCTYNEEGQRDFEIEWYHVYYLPQKGRQVKTYNAGISLNLTSGSVHYVYISFKGLTGIEMEEVDEKKAEKLFKDKDLDTLPALVDGEPVAKGK